MKQKEWKQKRVKDYLIYNQKLGSGAYSIVYLGKNIEGQEIAVKCIDKNQLEEDEKNQKRNSNQKKKSDVLTRFQREYKIWIKLDFHFIVKLYEFQESINNIYYFMELCDTDLAQMIEAYQKEQKYFDQNLAYYIFFQLCDSLFKLKQIQVCHRDLKPQNIFFKQKQLKLGDFGFSKFVEDEFYQSQQLGSPQYMPPEALLSQNYNPYLQDVWSLGVILYYLLYFKYPWIGSDSMELFNNIISNPQINFNSSIKINKNVQNTIIGMLNICPEKRVTWEQIQEDKQLMDFKKEIYEIYQGK